jgi:hypothetical protein
MVVPDGRVLPAIEEYAVEHACNSVMLIIADSLGLALFRHFEGIMPNMRELANQGMLLRCESPARHTSPCIASILTDYLPGHHRIHATEDIYRERGKDPGNPNIRTIPEWAEDVGFRAAVVMEASGAVTFDNRIAEWHGVPDSEDILDYDSRITACALKALENNPTVLALHLRAIDRYAHRASGWIELKEALQITDANLGKLLAKAGEKTLVLICGDHAIHGSDRWLKDAGREDVLNHERNLVALVCGVGRKGRGKA